MFRNDVELRVISGGGEYRPIRPRELPTPKPTVWAVVDGRVRQVECVRRQGDWAVTTYDGFVSMTHLPTGAAAFAVTADANHVLELADALPAFAQLQHFDLQSFALVTDEIGGVIADCGLKGNMLRGACQ